MLKRNITVFLLLAILILTPVSSTSCDTEDAVLIVGGTVIVMAIITYYYILPRAVIVPHDNTNQSVSCGDLPDINIINETGATWEFCLAGEHIGSIQPDTTAVFPLNEGIKDAVFSCDVSKYPAIFEKNLIIDDQYAIVIREVREIGEIR